MRRTAAALALSTTTLAAAAAARGRAMRRHGVMLDTRPGLGADGVVAGGTAIELTASASAPAALVLHGFGDTPQSVGYLAGYLHAHGWAVQAPLLPGHGRTLRAFTASRADEWIAHARRAYRALRRRHRRVAIVGQSMGGAVATVLAAELSPDALALVAPYLEMPTHLRHLARAHPLWAPVLPLVASGGDRSILDEAERAASLAHGVVSGRVLAELRRVVERACAALPAVSAPALVVQSRRDHRIAPAACERAVARLGSRRKRLVWLDDGGHVLAVDRGRERLFALLAAWLDAELARPAPRRAVAGRAAAGIV